MTTDAPAPDRWLVADPVIERVELAGEAWLDVVRGLVPEGQRVHDELAATLHWEQGRVFRYERWVPEPRLGAWQPASAMHPALAEVQTWLTRRYRISFDGVALAQYRDGRDSVAWHRDREMRWLDDTVIGVLSLGATRPFLLRPLTGRRVAEEDDDLGDVLDARPASGDLLVMGGRCQQAWLHAVPKVAGGCRSRISAQWRWTSKRGGPDTNPGYRAPRHYTRRD